MKHATLIVIDGADNAGKATQTKMLLERLQKEGKNVGTLAYPQYEENVFGELIQECLNGEHGDFLSLDPKIASTLYAADRYESRSTLDALLEDCDVVVLDRYVSANMLHQGAKIEDESDRITFLEWLEGIEYGIFGMPKPDLTIALFLKEEDAAQLLSSMVEKGEKTADKAESDRVHQQMVSACAHWLVASREAWIAVHCSHEEGGVRRREDIHEEIYRIASSHI
jgi:dTMP kinase